MIIYLAASLLVLIALTPLISKFIELSKWFNRKSQHYVLGNWLEYTDPTSTQYFNYIKGYPKAWCLFMWSCRKDILSA